MFCCVLIPSFTTSTKEVSKLCPGVAKNEPSYGACWSDFGRLTKLDDYNNHDFRCCLISGLEECLRRSFMIYCSGEDSSLHARNGVKSLMATCSNYDQIQADSVKCFLKLYQNLLVALLAFILIILLLAAAVTVVKFLIPFFCCCLWPKYDGVPYHHLPSHLSSGSGGSHDSGKMTGSGKKKFRWSPKSMKINNNGDGALSV